MKKILPLTLFAAGMLVFSATAQAEILNNSATMQEAIDFTPSNKVLVDYYAGNDGAEEVAGGQPQQYVAASKHTGGTRVYVTTESSNITYQESDDWRGAELSTSLNADYSTYLGTNIIWLNQNGWTPL